LRRREKDESRKNEMSEGCEEGREGRGEERQEKAQKAAWLSSTHRLDDNSNDSNRHENSQLNNKEETGGHLLCHQEVYNLNLTIHFDTNTGAKKTAGRTCTGL